jgi:hypothetical protein
MAIWKDYPEADISLEAAREARGSYAGEMAYRILKDCKLVNIQGGNHRKPNLNHPYYRDYRIMNYKASPPID